MAQTPLGRGGEFFEASQIWGESSGRVAERSSVPAATASTLLLSLQTFFIALGQPQLAALPPTKLFPWVYILITFFFVR